MRIYETRIGRFKILRGRTAADNEILTHDIARGSDLLFHAAGIPGAHVVLQGEDPSPEVIRIAADTAAQHSKGSGRRVKILYTMIRNVSRGSKIGQVKIRHAKTINGTREK